MARKKNLTNSGLPSFLSSALRTVKLKELAEKRGTRLHILRKFIERVLFPSKGGENNEKNKLKIEDLAPQVDLKPGTWNRLEKAESCLSIEAADWIAVKVLKNFGVFVTSEWLLAETDNEELPRLINKEPFNVYGYLKDIYKAEELSKALNAEQKIKIKEFYADLETSKKLNDVNEFKKFIQSIEKDLNFSKLEKDKLTEIMKKATADPFEKEDCTFLLSICRRLIVSSDISSEEKSTRLVLAGYFMSDLFQKINPESVITYVRDNKMAPVFCKGEIVGGTLVSLKNLRKVEKRECIIGLKNSLKIVRVVHCMSDNTIIASTHSNENTPEIYSLNDIEYVAVVLFRYKNLERDGLSIGTDGENTPTLIRFEDIRV